MNPAGFLRGILDQKRTLEQDLAARPTPRAFALTAAEQRFIFLFVNICAEKTAELARRLLRAKLDSR